MLYRLFGIICLNNFKRNYFHLPQRMSLETCDVTHFKNLGIFWYPYKALLNVQKLFLIAGKRKPTEPFTIAPKLCHTATPQELKNFARETATKPLGELL